VEVGSGGELKVEGGGELEVESVFDSTSVVVRPDIYLFGPNRSILDDPVGQHVKSYCGL
jgi:hypothetical protein